MSSFYPKTGHDTVMQGERLLAHLQAAEVKRFVAFQVEQEMYKSMITKRVLADRMGTSRAALDRLLDPENVSVTLNTLEKVALALNKRLKVELS